MDIKPIETIYNGYRFRSRLEARWAVFLDKAGITYEYEPEGFYLPNGIRYLPDFYLPWFKAFVEIKPKSISEYDLDMARKKCEELCGWQSHIALLCIGDPCDNGIEVYCFESDESGGGNLWEEAQFIEGAHFKENVWDDDSDELGHMSKHWICIAVGPDKDHKNRSYLSLAYEPVGLYQRALITDYRQDFSLAKTAARQARFEHGECGAPDG